MSMTTRRIVIGLSVILAFLAGYFLGVNLVFPGSVKKLFRDAADTGYFAAVISLGTLDRLERGDVDGAKRLLAQNISIYCRSDLPDADPTRRIQLRRQVEELTAHSPALREQLAKPSPWPQHSVSRTAADNGDQILSDI
jgi:hypothetical protein